MCRCLWSSWMRVSLQWPDTVPAATSLWLLCCEGWQRIQRCTVIQMMFHLCIYQVIVVQAHPDPDHLYVIKITWLFACLTGQIKEVVLEAWPIVRSTNSNRKDNGKNINGLPGCTVEIKEHIQVWTAVFFSGVGFWIHWNILLCFFFAM